MFVEYAIQVNTIEHHCGAHAYRSHIRTEVQVERPALHPQVRQRLLAVEPPLIHGCASLSGSVRSCRRCSSRGAKRDLDVNNFNVQESSKSARKSCSTYQRTRLQPALSTTAMGPESTEGSTGNLSLQSRKALLWPRVPAPVPASDNPPIPAQSGWPAPTAYRSGTGRPSARRDRKSVV